MTESEPARHHGARPAVANFDPVASVYRWAEYLCLGPLLQRTREHLLPLVLGARKALVLGDGDGRFLAELLRRAPSMQALAVDSSAAMLQRLQGRCRFAGPRLRTLHGDVNELHGGLENLGDVDLVTTHFLLDCLLQREVEDLAAHLAETVQPGALWLISEFGIPQGRPWRWLGGLYVRGLYRAFRVLTGLRARSLPDLAAALERAGFLRIHRSERLRGLLYSELWQLSRTTEPAAEARFAQLDRARPHPPLL